MRRFFAARKWTNIVLAGIYLLGLVFMLVMMVIIRYRLDGIVEVTI